MKTMIYSDGGSRGNPGESAIGFVIWEKDDKILEYGAPIGTATNNMAEYQAVLQSIKKAKALGYTQIQLLLDSQLVERQLNGAYKVKSAELLPIYADIKMEIKSLEKFSVEHVPREKNKDADRLVNEALDTGEIIERKFSSADSSEKQEKILVADGNSSNDNPEQELKNLFAKSNIVIHKMMKNEGELIVFAERSDIPKLIFIFDEVNRLAKATGARKIKLEYEVE